MTRSIASLLLRAHCRCARDDRPRGRCFVLYLRHGVAASPLHQIRAYAFTVPRLATVDANIALVRRSTLATTPPGVGPSALGVPTCASSPNLRRSALRGTAHVVELSPVEMPRIRRTPVISKAKPIAWATCLSSLDPAPGAMLTPCTAARDRPLRTDHHGPSRHGPATRATRGERSLRLAHERADARRVRSASAVLADYPVLLPAGEGPSPTACSSPDASPPRRDVSPDRTHRPSVDHGCRSSVKEAAIVARVRAYANPPRPMAPWTRRRAGSLRLRDRVASD